MDAVSVASSSRLLEAFERMGISQGEGLVSSGPSPVPDSLARAFEKLLEQADVQPQTATPSARPAETQAAFPSLETEQAHGTEPVNGVSGAESSASAAGPELISPAEFYHLQFQAAMLRHEAETASQVTQKTTQGLDSLLRNQS